MPDRISVDRVRTPYVMGDDDSTANAVKAPSYNELFSIVTELFFMSTEGFDGLAASSSNFNPNVECAADCEYFPMLEHQSGLLPGTRRAIKRTIGLAPLMHWRTPTSGH